MWRFIVAAVSFCSLSLGATEVAVAQHRAAALDMASVSLHSTKGQAIVAIQKLDPSFRLKASVVTVKIRSGKPISFPAIVAERGNTAGRVVEIFRLTLSSDHDNAPVLAVERAMSFDPGKMPSTNDLKRRLSEKYGRFEKSGCAGNRYVAHTVVLSRSLKLGWLGWRQLGRGNLCRTRFFYKVSPASANSRLAEKIDMYIIDEQAVFQIAKSSIDRDKADAEARRIKEDAGAVKPKL